MKISDLISYLNSNVTALEIRKTIENEIKEFIKNHDALGSSLPVYCTDDHSTYEISRNEIIKILNDYIVGNLNEYELEYLCNVMEMSEIIEYDKPISEILFLVGTPEINGEINKKYVEELIQKINQ
jgi:hypothetical protein